MLQLPIKLLDFSCQPSAKPFARVKSRCGTDHTRKKIAHCFDRQAGVGKLTNTAGLLDVLLSVGTIAGPGPPGSQQALGLVVSQHPDADPAASRHLSDLHPTLFSA